jgi:antitoxin MazE
MKASIIKIGNSRGVRIPKFLLEESGLNSVVELKLRGGEIIISPPKKVAQPRVNAEALLSESALSDWLRPEEDEAWKSLQ